MGSITNPNAVFAEYRRRLGGFDQLAEELRRIEGFPTRKPLSNRFLQLPSWCIFIESWPHLPGFGGPTISSLSASHQLAQASMREAAFRWISTAVDTDNRMLIHDFRDLDFQSHGLEKPGKIGAVGGWTRDAEVNYRGFFITVNLDCQPCASKAEYFVSLWNEVFRSLQVNDHVVAISENSGWLVQSRGNLRIKCMAGGLRGENPKSLAVYGYESLQDVETALGRLSPLGQRRRASIFCRVSGETYEEASRKAVGFGLGWEVSASCDLSPADKDALRRHAEPSVSRLPGASFSWPMKSRQSKAHFSCGFSRIDGAWWSILGAFCATPEASLEFTSMVASHGYEKTT